MSEMILSTKALPKYLFQIIQTEQVKVSEANGTISLTPIQEQKNIVDELFGKYRNEELTVDKFLEWKHADKELEL